MGEGKDVRNLYARRLNDERAPLFFGGSPGTPIPERFFQANVMSYMQEPLIDLATCGTLVEVDGREVRTGNPIEIVSTRRELQYMRQGSASDVPGWACWPRKARSLNSATWPRRTLITCALVIHILCPCSTNSRWITATSRARSTRSNTAWSMHPCRASLSADWAAVLPVRRWSMSLPI
ncbi:MAG: monomethylamine:corrinoid methyltransferase [Anaerolineales bacterium]|nr:monomethylamine:corrinoid methyltransferase [Anaerolineales bacterium]